MFDGTQGISLPGKGGLENYFFVCDAHRERLPCESDNRENYEEEPNDAETWNKQSQRDEWQGEEDRDPQNRWRFSDDNQALISGSVERYTGRRIA